MVRSPCCAKQGMNKGAWSSAEDEILINYVKIHGAGKWRTVAHNAGLNRCAKSCRLRWLNYLRPGIKRGGITKDEEDLIIRLHRLLGNRWALIAGRLPGRTDNEIKNYWNTTLVKKLGSFSPRLCMKERATMADNRIDHGPMANCPNLIPSDEKHSSVPQIPVLLLEDESHVINRMITSSNAGGSNVHHDQNLVSSALVGDDENINNLSLLTDINLMPGVPEPIALMGHNSNCKINEELIVGGGARHANLISPSSASSTTLNSASGDEVNKLVGWVESHEKPSLDVELKKLACFLDLEEE